MMSKAFLLVAVAISTVACGVNPKVPLDATWLPAAEDAVAGRIRSFRAAKGRWPQNSKDLLGRGAFEVEALRAPATTGIKSRIVLSSGNVTLTPVSLKNKSAEYKMFIQGYERPLLLDEHSGE